MCSYFIEFIKRVWEKGYGDLSLIRNEFNVNNTKAWILDSIYHLTLRLLWNLFLAIKRFNFCHYVRNFVMDVITFPKFYKPLVVYQFYCMALFHSQMRLHIKCVDENNMMFIFATRLKKFNNKHECYILFIMWYWNYLKLWLYGLKTQDFTIYMRRYHGRHVITFLNT